MRMVPSVSEVTGWRVVSAEKTMPFMLFAIGLIVLNATICIITTQIGKEEYTRKYTDGLHRLSQSAQRWAI